jgi:hypothetical protein
MSRKLAWMANIPLEDEDGQFPKDAKKSPEKAVSKRTLQEGDVVISIIDQKTRSELIEGNLIQWRIMIFIKSFFDLDMCTLMAISKKDPYI